MNKYSRARYLQYPPVSLPLGLLPSFFNFISFTLCHFEAGYLGSQLQYWFPLHCLFVCLFVYFFVFLLLLFCKISSIVPKLFPVSLGSRQLRNPVSRHLFRRLPQTSCSFHCIHSRSIKSLEWSLKSRVT